MPTMRETENPSIDFELCEHEIRQFIPGVLPHLCSHRLRDQAMIGAAVSRPSLLQSHVNSARFPVPTSPE